MKNIKDLFKELLEEGHRVDTTEYQKSHGKKPHGTGNWFIKVNGKGYHPTPNMSLGDAIKKAIQMAHEDNNKSTVDVVEPQP